MHEIYFIYALTRLRVPPKGKVPPVQNFSSGIYQERYLYTNLFCIGIIYTATAFFIHVESSSKHILFDCPLSL
jgi:hypothetical protein